jgi:hypothetical protein
MPGNQDNRPPQIPSIGGRDLLSLNLGALSQQLMTLDLSGIFSNDLFSHGFGWPQLQRLQLWMFMCTPSGEWMIEKDPEDSDSGLDVEPYEDLSDYMHEHQLLARIHYPNNPCRTLPRKDLVCNFFLAARLAAARMPKLQSMVVLSEPSVVTSSSLHGRMQLLQGRGSSRYLSEVRDNVGRVFCQPSYWVCSHRHSKYQ